MKWLTGRLSLSAMLVLSAWVPGQAQTAPVSYQVLRSLGGSDGSGPESGLVLGADGRFYGTASSGGGPDGAGTIFRAATDGTFTVVHTFRHSAPQGGLHPAGLIRGRDNHLYGTTAYGGVLADGTSASGDGAPVGDGVVYRLSWDPVAHGYAGVTVLHTFDCSTGSGGDPWGSLIEGPDGALYGITAPSSVPDPACGNVSVVFKLGKDGSGFSVLARFNFLEHGSHQFGPLAIGADGSVFGTLVDSAHPHFRYGSIFKIAPGGTATFVKVFDGIDGAYPFSGLVRGADDAFYGTTYRGGSDGVGTIFRITEDGAFARLHSFQSMSVHTPYSPLVVGGDGLIYGAAHAGGGAPGCGFDADGAPFGCGGTYIFDPPAPIGRGAGFRVHSVFDRAVTGSDPYGPLAVGPRPGRHLYGAQSTGGVSRQGTIFGLPDISVANRPPFPVAMVSSNPVEALTADGGTVSFSARGSSDADFDDLTYTWTLPPGVQNLIEAPDRSALEATFPIGHWDVTLTVSDGEATRARTVRVEVFDAPPVFSGTPADVTTWADHAAGRIVLYQAPTATDVIDGPSPVTCTPASGSTFPVGATPVVCTASDLHGQSSQVSFTVTVTPAVVLAVPAGLVIEATGPAGAPVNYQVTAATGSGVALTPSCAPASGSMFPFGLTRVHCSAVDPTTQLGASESFDVTVVDTVPPQISMDINGIEYNAEGPHGAVVQYDDPARVLPGRSPSAFDLVDGDVPVECDPGPGLFPLGRTRVTCRAVDRAGNESTFMFDVVVRDSDDPVLHVPAPIVAEATGPGGAVVAFTVTATDVTSPEGLIVSCDRSSGALFPLGTTTVSCSAVDGAARRATGGFTVTVIDTTPPVLDLPAHRTLPAPSAAGTVVTYTATAVDLVDGRRPVSCTPASGSTFPIGTTVVNCTAADTRGNQVSGSFSQSVIVVGPPSLSVSLSPDVLWPPNHNLVTITATIAAAFPSGPQPVVTLVSIGSSEPDQGLGDGDRPGDIQGAAFGTDDRVFQLRAERSGKGPGRVYSVVYRAEHPLNPDIAAVVSATVVVPGNKGETRPGQSQ